MYEQVKDHIRALGDAELIQYILVGRRMYDEDAVAFAREELHRRNLPPERFAAFRRQVAENLIHADAVSPPPPSRTIPAVVCQRCGFEAPTRFALYDQQIGAIFIRFSERHEGWFCRSCNHRLFWKVTAINIALGWWGTIAFFTNIMNLIGNAVTFARSLTMPGVPPDSAPPTYDDPVIARIAPHYPLIAERLFEMYDPNDIAREVAPIAGVTPGQAWRYVQQVRPQHTGIVAAPQSPPTFGFPVEMSGRPPDDRP